MSLAISAAARSCSRRRAPLPTGSLVKHRVAGVVFHLQVHGRFRAARKILDHADDLGNGRVFEGADLDEYYVSGLDDEPVC